MQLLIFQLICSHDNIVINVIPECNQMWTSSALNVFFFINLISNPYNLQMIFFYLFFNNINILTLIFFYGEPLKYIVFYLFQICICVFISHNGNAGWWLTYFPLYIYIIEFFFYSDSYVLCIWQVFISIFLECHPQKILDPRRQNWPCRYKV